MRMIKVWLVTWISIVSLHANEPTFFSVAPKSGDGIYTLLKRYQLNIHSCNLEKFYELNGMQANSNLVDYKNYSLPILIYSYDGKSIRSTIGIQDWDKAVRIQKYNENLVANGLRKAHYTANNILWVPYEEISCDSKTEAETPVSTSGKAVMVSNEEGEAETARFIHEPLFGSKYSKIPFLDHSLKHKVYYIVSGHGGPDPGAVCKSCPEDLCEDEYAYDVAARLARNLMQHGAIVYMIVQDKNDGIRDERYLPCDKDEVSIGGHSIPLNQKKRLYQRTDAINSLYKKHLDRGIKDQKAIMIHVDSRNENNRQDVFFYHYRNSDTGKKMAETMRNVFEKKYSTYQKNRGYHGYVEGKSLYVLKNSHPPAVFVELANIKNKADHKRLLESSNRQALANWLFEGLIAH